MAKRTEDTYPIRLLREGLVKKGIAHGKRILETIWYTRPLRIAHELMIDRQGRRKHQVENGRREWAYMLPGVLYCNKE